MSEQVYLGLDGWYFWVGNDAIGPHHSKELAEDAQRFYYTHVADDPAVSGVPVLHQDTNDSADK